MKIKQPVEIENRSFEIIKSEVNKEKFDNIPDELKSVIVRIIHSTADFDFLDIVKFSDNFYHSATNALKKGCNILTDIKMVKYGISSRLTGKFGNKTETFIDTEDVINLAKNENITRSIAAMRLHGKWADNGLIVIGNAPTALFEILSLIEQGQISPAAVIGVPVGFVGASESKDALIKFGGIPYLTATGRKGGTPVAVAAVNALLKLIN